MATITLIAALGRNNAIGRDNGLLWRLKTDMKNLRAATMGKPIIMGRKTFESLPRALPGRLNIVLSRNPGRGFAGAVAVTSMEAALLVARAELLRRGIDDIMVIGGADIYRQFLPQATHLLLTHVDDAPAADAFFPDFSAAEWREIEGRDVPAGADDEHGFRISRYQRQ